MVGQRRELFKKSFPDCHSASTPLLPNSQRFWFPFLDFVYLLCPRNTLPIPSTPGTNQPVSNALGFLVAIWNYQLFRKKTNKPQNQAKWLERLPRGLFFQREPERGLQHLQVGQFALFFQPHRICFSFCSARKQGHALRWKQNRGFKC